jgi:rhodanese-related sulfurtransferase
LVLLSNSIADGEDKKGPSETAAVELKTPARYCGLFCLYSIIKTTTCKKISFEELIKPEYVGSYLGSSLAELQEAAEDYGLNAVPASKLTSRMLRNCPGLVILHVKSDLAVDSYDHYQLFLGTEMGKAKLFDPPNAVKLVPFEELATYWDGKGLIVSTKPIDFKSVFASARRRFVLCAGAVIVAMAFIHLVKSRLPKNTDNSRRRFLYVSAGQAAGLAIGALVSGMIYHFVDAEGLLANANGTASVQQAHRGKFIPRVSKREVIKLLNTDAVFIDTRIARDFKAGHLSGAINIPFRVSDDEHRELTSDIPKDARVVLYSVHPKFTEVVAVRLLEDGYLNVSIFEGGWDDLSVSKDKTESTTL